MPSHATKSRRLDVPIDITLDLFDKLVLPILIYGSEVWGHSNLKHIEICYRNFIRRLLKLGESTSNCMLYGETGKTRIQPIIEKRMISFWLRFTQDKPQRLIYVVYSFIIKMRNKNQYESQWIGKNGRDSSELWDVPLLEKLKYGYPIYQLMYKRTNQ